MSHWLDSCTCFFSFRFIVIPSLLPPALLGTVVIIFVFSCLSLALLGMEVLEFEFWCSLWSCWRAQTYLISHFATYLYFVMYSTRSCVNCFRSCKCTYYCLFTDGLHSRWNIHGYTVLLTQSLICWFGEFNCQKLASHLYCWYLIIALMETFCFFHDQGILSASVLSVIPLIRPYQWQSLLMPVWFLSFQIKININFLNF